MLNDQATLRFDGVCCKEVDVVHPSPSQLAASGENLTVKADGYWPTARVPWLC